MGTINYHGLKPAVADADPPISPRRGCPAASLERCRSLCPSPGRPCGGVHHAWVGRDAATAPTTASCSGEKPPPLRDGAPRPRLSHGRDTRHHGRLRLSGDRGRWRRAPGRPRCRPTAVRTTRGRSISSYAPPSFRGLGDAALLMERRRRGQWALPGHRGTIATPPLCRLDDKRSPLQLGCDDVFAPARGASPIVPRAQDAAPLMGRHHTPP